MFTCPDLHSCLEDNELVFDSYHAINSSSCANITNQSKLVSY